MPRRPAPPVSENTVARRAVFGRRLDRIPSVFDRNAKQMQLYNVIYNFFFKDGEIFLSRGGNRLTLSFELTFYVAAVSLS